MEIYVDTARIEEIESVKGMVSGITTNPTLMRKAGVLDYLEHARSLSRTFPLTPLSLEVIADVPDEMLVQGHKLSEIGHNVIVKIPIVNSKGESCEDVVHELTTAGIMINVTAVFTYEQFEIARGALIDTGGIVSVFAGRIADTGIDPVAMVRRMARELRKHNKPRVKLLWASTREILNYEHAEAAMCDIITMTPDLVLKRGKLRHKDLVEFSVDTASMFYEDARKSGYSI